MDTESVSHPVIKLINGVEQTRIQTRIQTTNLVLCPCCGAEIEVMEPEYIEGLDPDQPVIPGLLSWG